MRNLHIIQKRPNIAFASVCALLITSLFIHKIQADEINHTDMKPALTVEAISPHYETWTEVIQASGSIKPWQEASISSEISGLQIRNILADIGDVVKKGQLLVELNQETLLANLQQHESMVKQAELDLQEATNNANRARSVDATGALSSQQSMQYLIAEKKAQAQLDAAKAALKTQQIYLQQTKIVAPDDGIISQRSAILGAVTVTGSELFKMVRQARVEWHAEVSSIQLPQIKPGQTANVHLDNQIIAQGKVRAISPTLSESNRHATVYVDLPNEMAKAGMFASGEIIIGQKEALVIPLSAIVIRDGNTYVFEIDNNHTVIQRQIKTGRQQASFIEVISGINKDASLVNSGAAFLSQGDLIRLVSRPQ